MPQVRQGAYFFYPKMIPYYDKRLIYAIYSRWAAYVSSFICDIRCPFFAPLLFRICVISSLL